MTPNLLRQKLDRLRAEIDRRNRGLYVKHEPFEAQRAFLNLDCFEALYGGAAGSGKSDALLMAALQHVHVSGYSALLLRRTYRDLALPGAIMDRAHQWLQGTDAHWNGIDKCWLFPSGAKLQFGYLDTEHDKYRYQGAELQFIGFDELTQFQESQYVYLLSRLRRLVGSSVPLRARSATNPGGVGHDWVHRRFVDNATRGARDFVPATLAHNPHLDQDSYRSALGALDEITRRQLLHGEWIQDSSGLVYHYDDATNGIDELPRSDRWTYYLGVDFGFTDHTAFTVLGWREYDTTVYVAESFSRAGIIPSEAAAIVQELTKQYHFERIIGDTGGMGKAYTEEMRRRYAIPIEAADKTNKLGYISLLNGALEEATLKVHRILGAPLVTEWGALQWHASRQKEHDGFPNHCADATLYAWRAAYSYQEGKAPCPRPELGSIAQYQAEAARLEERAVQEWQRNRDEMDLLP